ncbi:MAG: hypothetical protein LIO44_05530 [Eubacterium sp.]|nr:hypothetical protein [Eubacterium sp.]
MNKVCIVNVYFGKYPNYFELFLKSCYFNKKIDFLLLTDQEIFTKDNVHVVRSELSEFKKLVGKKLGFEVSLDTPYKLCDYKCAYGKILEDYLKEYDYWGHCDCDLIWGDIYHFLCKYEFEKYDKFLSMGHLSLYRNIPKNNVSFMLEGSAVGDYKTVYTSSKIFLFDEALGIDEIYKNNKISFFDKPIFADIDPIYKNYKLQEFGRFPYNKEGGYNQYFFNRGINKKQQIFLYDNGKIIRCYYEKEKLLKDEFMYIHFQKRRFDDTCCIAKGGQVILSPKGFFDFEGVNIDFDLIKQYNRPYSSVCETFQYIFYLKKRWGNALKRKMKGESK